MKPRVLLKHSVVALDWVDSEGRHGWRSGSRATKKGCIKELHSIGYVVGTSETAITISTSIDGKYAESPLSIPWVAVKSCRVVKL